jgi:hypothetical protein
LSIATETIPGTADDVEDSAISKLDIAFSNVELVGAIKVDLQSKIWLM